MSSPESIWKDRNFIKFFSANALSNLGNWFDFVSVLILFRYTWKADPMLIALIPVMYAVPSILFGQFAGVFADQKDQLKILVYSDWIRAGLTVLLIVSPAPLFALPVLLLRNTAGVVSLPAQQGLMRRIVDEENIMKAVTLNGSLFQLVKVIGPLIGGSVAGILSPRFSIGMNAVSFMLSAIVLLRIRLRQQNDSTQAERTASSKPSNFLSSWKEGWMIVLRNRILLASVLFGIGSTLTIQMIDAQIVTLFSEVFPNTSEITGWAISAIGIGSLIIVLLLNRMKSINKYGWFFGGGSLLIGVMVWGFGFMANYNYTLLAICLSLIGGVGNGMVFTAVNYLIQKEPPQQAIGRVSGIVDSTLSVLFIAGPLLGGVMISQFGILAAFKGIGMSLTFIGFSGILFQKLLWKRNKNTENNKIDSDGEAVS